MAFDWTRWPYDPQAINKEDYRKALEALKQQADEGRYLVDRALGALDVAASLAVSRAEDLERVGASLELIDTTNRDVRRTLEDAMDRVYQAVGALDNLK